MTPDTTGTIGTTGSPGLDPLDCDWGRAVGWTADDGVVGCVEFAAADGATERVGDGGSDGVCACEPVGFRSPE